MEQRYILDYLKSAKLALVMGKGGVGKTSISAGLAELSSQAGINTLVATVDPAGRLNDWYTGKIGPQPTKIHKALDAIIVDQAVVLDEIVESYTQDYSLRRQIKASPLYQVIGKSLPGLPETMAVWKIKQLLDKDSYDLIIVDLPPKGQGEHFLNLSDTVQRALDTVSVARLQIEVYDGYNRIKSMLGSITSKNGKTEAQFYIKPFIDELRRVADETEAIFKDPSKTIFNIVLHAEKPVITETLSLYNEVQSLEIPFGFLIVNRTEAGLPADALKEYLSLKSANKLDKIAVEADTQGYGNLWRSSMAIVETKETIKKRQEYAMSYLRPHINEIPVFIVPEFLQDEDLPKNRQAFMRYLSEPNRF
jgi:anion-transporting  ArsA/GET3 family ATPase